MACFQCEMSPNRPSVYSRQQITRLIQQYQARGIVKRRQRTVNGFQRRYTGADIRRLAEVDALHGTLSGPATKANAFSVGNW